MLAVLLTVILAPPQGVAATIERTAEVARQAFATHQFSSLFAGSPGVLMHFPEESMGRRANRAAAGAGLAAFVRRQQELEVTVLGARVVEQQFGYIELRRQFRLLGVQEEQNQRILLSVRLADGHWRVPDVLMFELGTGTG